MGIIQNQHPQGGSKNMSQADEVLLFNHRFQFLIGNFLLLDHQINQ
jgi:hypothetical protein